MALTKVRKIFADVEGLRSQAKFAAPIGSSIATIHPQTGQPVVTYAGTPGQTTTIGPIAGMTTTGVPVPDNGQSAGVTVVQTTGVYEGPVAGADVNTAPGTDVFIEADGDLTLTEGTNVYFGKVEFIDGLVRRGNRLPIRIGVAQ